MKKKLNQCPICTMAPASPLPNSNLKLVVEDGVVGIPVSPDCIHSRAISEPVSCGSPSREECTFCWRNCQDRVGG